MVRKLFKYTASDRVFLKSNLISGSLVKGARQPILSSFGVNKPPGYEIFEIPIVTQ